MKMIDILYFIWLNIIVCYLIKTLTIEGMIVTMKKTCKVSTYIKILSSLIILILILFSLPRKYNLNYSGIKYRLGDTSFEKKIKIKIQGSYTRNFFGKNKFKGKIFIDDIEIPKEIEEITIKLDNNNSGYLGYYYYNDTVQSFKNIKYGTIYFSSKLDQLTILIQEPEDLNAKEKQWNSGTGLMISAPAKNRTEALEISNDLFNWGKVKQRFR